jgi:hypothetical protein
LAPYELPLSLPLPATSHLQKEQDKAQNFVQHLQSLQAKVIQILQKTQEKKKQLMDQHHVPHHFKVGDKVWLHLDKCQFQDKAYSKVKPIRYGPYSIIQQVSKNAFHLDLPAHLGIHDVVNVDLLKPYHESTLETEILTSHPTDIVPDFQPLLDVDQVFN